MHAEALIPTLSTWSANNPFLAALAIIFATFVHEDLATVATGMVVANGMIGTSVALPSLYIGIILGDIGLYWLGRLAAANPMAARFLDRRSVGRLKQWLDDRLVMGVLIVRFLPGLRMSAYTTYGFFSMPLHRFIFSVLAGTGIWTTGLFFLSFKFGTWTEHWIGLWGYPALALSVVVPLLILKRFVDLGEC